jgi:DNA-binding MarR family transcriptional regulator
MESVNVRRNIMTDKFNDDLASLAEDIRAIGADFRFSLAVQLLNAGWLLDKYITAKARTYGQNRSRFDTMHTLIIHGGVVKPSDLSRMLFRSKQTVTQIIDVLERDGLVKRELAGQDRRTKRIIVTKRGLELIRTSLPDTLEVMNSAMPAMGEEEVQMLTAFLRKIRKHLVNQFDSFKSEGR